MYSDTDAPLDGSGSRPGEPQLPEEPSAPPTQPDPALVPPPRDPPTAVSAPGGEPPTPQPRRFSDPWRRAGWRAPAGLRSAVDDLLDAVDRVADQIASGLKLR